MSYQGLKTWKSDTYAYTHVPRASGLQLKTTFLDVLDYSEYFDDNISFFFHENTASVVRKQNE